MIDSAIQWITNSDMEEWMPLLIIFCGIITTCAVVKIFKG